MLKFTKQMPEVFQRRSALAHLSPSGKKLFEILQECPEVVGFTSNSYLQNNPDVFQAGIDPLLHYIMYGGDEGREVSLGFSARWYAEMNGLDEKNACDALLHMIQAKSDSSRQKVAFFGYAWNSKWHLDAYMSEIVSTIADFGLDVDVFIGNQFTPMGGPRGFNSDITKKELGSFVKNKSYDFAISFNNSLTMPETVKALQCTIVSVIVDSVHHLFDHIETGDYAVFKLPIHAAPIYASLIDDLNNNLGQGVRASFLPAATRIGDRNFNAQADPIAIAWIASLVGDHNLDRLMLRIIELPSGLEFVGRCLSDIEKTGGIGLDDRSQAAAGAVCAWANWNYRYLEMQLQNVVTNSSRLSVVESLFPLGLEVFGNERWHAAFALSSAAARAYRTGVSLKRHSDLCAIYDRSKISINYPQAQAATGMQYRVLDVLASKSLLVTKRVPGSDIDRLFGAKSPIVTFDNISELRSKCTYFLNNEPERRDRVIQCNSLVARGFSFQERTLEYLSLSNAAALSSGVVAKSGRGVVTLVGIGVIKEWATRRNGRTA